MKTWIPYIAAAVVVVLLWFANQAHQQKRQAQEQVAQLQAQVTQLETQVADLQQQVESMRNGSIAGVVEEANSSLKHGLRTMLEAAEQEFNKLQKTLDETLEEWEQGIPQPNDPQPESNQSQSSDDNGQIHET